MNLKKLLLTVFCVCSILSACESLKCRSDDGPSEEEVKKVVRTCMRKIGDNNSPGHRSTGRNTNAKDSSEESDEDDYDNSNENDNNRNRNSNNYNGNYPNNRNDRNDRNDRMDRNDRRNRYKRENQNNQQWDDIHNFQDQNHGYNYSGGRQDFDDSSCITQCFFQEMKMTNSNGFPDKHKVLQVITKDIREHDLKEFYIDSIEECFHILEMENRREKCSMAKNLVECLTERAKANCDDFHDETVIF